MLTKTLALVVVAIVGGSLPEAGSALVIPVTKIGNPGNPPHVPTRMGRVRYTYYLSEEITNAQYAEYWRATHDGQEYVWRYADEGMTAFDPVGVSDPIDAVRFVNWLHNGQGDADTESGAYTITTFPRHEDSPILNGYWIAQRNPGAKWFVPSLDEWVKAFYLVSNTLSQAGALPYSWHGGEWTETIVTGLLYPWQPQPFTYYFSAVRTPTLTSTNDIRYVYPLTPYLSFRVGTTLPSPATTNGTPLTWLFDYDLSTDDSDSDLDGFTGWQEYICGTDPTNGRSCFTVSLTSSSLAWTVASNRLYSVECSTNLMTGFAQLTNGLTASPFPVAAGTNTLFFRMKAQLDE